MHGRSIASATSSHAMQLQCTPKICSFSSSLASLHTVGFVEKLIREIFVGKFVRKFQLLVWICSRNDPVRNDFEIRVWYAFYDANFSNHFDSSNFWSIWCSKWESFTWLSTLDYLINAHCAFIYFIEKSCPVRPYSIIVNYTMTKSFDQNTNDIFLGFLP